MIIDELKKYVSIKEIKGDCVRVKANEGYMLKLGDSYTEELYCERSAIPDNIAVIPYNAYLIDSNKEKYKGMTVEKAKEKLVAEITAYDKSDKVNGFYLNDTLIPWSSDDGSTLNKDVRMGLRQNIKDKQKLGEVNIDMWLDGMKITLPCEKADAFMCNLENYAYECFNVTSAHKAAVAELKTIKEVEAFDVTADYPQQLVMKL